MTRGTGSLPYSGNPKRGTKWQGAKLARVGKSFDLRQISLFDILDLDPKYPAIFFDNFPLSPIFPFGAAAPRHMLRLYTCCPWPSPLLAPPTHCGYIVPLADTIVYISVCPMRWENGGRTGQKGGKRKAVLSKPCACCSAASATLRWPPLAA